MKTVLTTALAAAAAIAAIPALSGPASAETKLGLLGCHSDGSTGFIIGSSKDLVCEFTPAGNGEREVYAGTLNTFGLDVGVTGRTTMQWAVLETGTDAYEPHALAGVYTGASANASAIVGGGANVLVGGDNGFTLQPVSVQEQEGINAAIGVSKFTLAPAEPVVTGDTKVEVPAEPAGAGTVVPK
ncbi:DUF992 domain-containing protein [Aurantimonas sp. VKM B-3413]|uniref:DUF992 domain-containing protein n=1 Tax=Aurantimonas sp. VKM B-3413 TaxID=2779401 RepID=UPI001E2A93D2|nr:DUF992 domain-containing protein [Aurantimonas sp. VKM B-3413]MCB8838941.1 DUF992 domain-containing protein [Aurantimonas sp. VKM B-3413]